MNEQLPPGGQPIIHPSVTAKFEQDKKDAALKLQVPAGNQSKNSVERRTFYSRIDGSFYVLKSGHKCTFEGGEYVTDKQAEIEELDELCALQGQYLINKEHVPCKRSDAQILKEVGGRGGGVVSGVVSSAGLMGMVK
jgi:hypothetical protein